MHGPARCDKPVRESSGASRSSAEAPGETPGDDGVGSENVRRNVGRGSACGDWCGSSAAGSLLALVLAARPAAGPGRLFRRVGAEISRGSAGAGAGAGAGRLPRASDQRGRAAQGRQLGGVHSDAAGMAVPSAFGRLHLARSLAAHDPEGRGSADARDRRVSRRVAAIDRQPGLPRRSAASLRRRACTAGAALRPGNGKATC